MSLSSMVSAFYQKKNMSKVVFGPKKIKETQRGLWPNPQLRAKTSQHSPVQLNSDQFTGIKAKDKCLLCHATEFCKDLLHIIIM